MAEGKIQHVIVDSAGFIRNAPLREIAEHIYTINSVVGEIRDKATRQRLQVLPYELKFKEPSTESILAVTDFAKKTGDYKSLSAIDIRVMALTYQLEKECHGVDHLRKKPERNTTWTTTKSNIEKATDIAGFYLKKQPTPDESKTTSISECNEEEEENEASLKEKLENVHIRTGDLDQNEQTHKTGYEDKPELINNKVVDLTVKDSGESSTTAFEEGGKDERLFREGEVLKADELGEEECSEEEEEEDEAEEDDDEDGWITPSNIKEIKKTMNTDANLEKAVVEVGCLTTDFAMQNVLIQMGMNVVSVEGMLIKRAKSYALRCHSCMKVTTDLSRDFCPNCGNQTLQRVSMTVNEDGSIQYFLSKRRPISTRGTKYSLPKPQGGKHAVNPILCEDQMKPRQHTARQGKVKYDVFDPDYASFGSPFAPIDTHSRAAQLGIKTGGVGGFHKRRNPNEGRKKTGRKK